MTDERPVLTSCIAVVGPKSLVKEATGELHGMFNRIFEFYTPDDCGEFPDTTGYQGKDWQNFESDLEDPTLYPYMQKALDAVVEFNLKKAKGYEGRGFRDIEPFLHAPKFGGQVWAVAGIIKGFPPGVLVLPKAYQVPLIIH